MNLSLIYLIPLKIKFFSKIFMIFSHNQRVEVPDDDLLVLKISTTA